LLFDNVPKIDIKTVGLFRCENGSNIGALAPEIVRLYRLRNKPPGKFSSFYILVSLAFAALGGVVALVLPATTVWAAFYAGVTWPTLVSTIAHHREKPVALANSREDFIIKAHDMTPSKLKQLVELFRDHADGLF